MKKIIALLLVATLVLSFAACGKKDSAEETTQNGNINQATQEATEEAQGTKSLFDKSKYTEKKSEPYVKDDKSYSVSIQYHLNEDPTYVLPNEMLVDTTKVVFGTTTPNDIKNDGWSLSSGAEKYILNSNITAPVYITNANGNEVTVYAINETENSINIVECPVNGAILYYNDARNAGKFTYADSINESSNISDIISALGYPKTIGITEYYDENDTLKSSDIGLYYIIDHIQVTFNFELNNNDEIKMVKADFTFNK